MKPEITKTKDQRPEIGNRIAWFLFAVAVIVVYFCGLNIPLLGPDEPRYAEVAREMFARGDWITPKLAGFDWFEKPALLYWLQIVSYHLFGVNEFAARFGSALFGLGTIFCLWILGRKISDLKFQISGEKPKDEKQNSNTRKRDDDASLVINHSSFANWLALVAASSIGLIVFSHAASFDIILTFPITASLTAFFIFDSTQKRCGNDAETMQNNLKSFSLVARRLPLVAFYFFIGVALIAKGLIGFFPFAIVAVYFLLARKLPDKTFVFSLLWGTILSLLVASIWYVPMYRANGWKFVDEFIIQQHFQRYLSNKYQHPQPFYYFFLVLPLLTIPWLPFFFAAVWDFFKVQSSRFKVQGLKSEVQSLNNLSTPAFRLSTFGFAWMIVPLVFFSLSGSKLPGYILPALPGALILTSEYVFRFVQNKSRCRFVLHLTAASMFVAVFAALQFFVPRIEQGETVKNLIAAANAQGYSNARILNLYLVSHNAEFYAAGRLTRTPDGKQKSFSTTEEIYEAIKDRDEPVLVLVAPDRVDQLIESDLLDAKVLADNGELFIVAVAKRAG